jgi:hypothetical protein
MELFIESKEFYQGKKINYQVNLSKKFNKVFETKFFYCFMALMSLSQLVGFIMMCHKMSTAKSQFIKRIQIIPSLQACMMDLLIVLICLNYFDVYKYLYVIQLIFLILKLPILVKYYKEPLFPAKKQKPVTAQFSQQQEVASDTESNYQNARTLQILSRRKQFVDNLPDNPWSLLFFLSFLTIIGNITLYVVSPE